MIVLQLFLFQQKQKQYKIDQHHNGDAQRLVRKKSVQRTENRSHCRSCQKHQRQIQNSLWYKTFVHRCFFSRFRFEAAGGNPGYTWSIIEGQLPDGLTMDENGVVDGYCETEGEYPFTLQVTDADGNTAVKETEIIVKVRPNKWFEEGKMSALSHNTGAYTQFFDENFSFDLWAERAKKAGMTMLSTEAVQGVYYWPAPGATYANRQHPYTLDENGQPKDMVGLAKEAAERHGLRFGVYYASEGSNRLPNGNTNNSSGFVMNVEDLMKRYDPSYLFFDGGPQNKGNVDAMWSAVRAYNDYALIQANDQNEAGDNDLTILENEYTGKMP